MKYEKWIQIPVAPLYEMNQRGEVRNIKSGRIIKPQKRSGHGNHNQFGLYIGGKCTRKNLAQSSLLWLTHGIVPEHKNNSPPFVPVTISHGNEKYHFDSCKQAAKFLAERECYSVSAATYHLSKRHEEIYGWRINYQR